MQSKAITVEQYLKELPDDRRAQVEQVRALVRKNIDSTIEECMQYGMIGYVIPHRVFPQGYHVDPKQPVPYAAIASQKNYMSLYVMTAYMAGDGDKELREGFAKAGKKLDMGKSCIRFKSVDDLDLPTIGRLLRKTTGKKHIEAYVASVGPDAWKKKAAKPAAKKSR